MPRRFVSDLGAQDNIDQVFLASQKQLRPNRNGNLYLQVDLSDRTGAITARMWNASEAEYRGFEDGDLVRVEGATQIYQGGLQLIATSICKARSDEVDMADFMNLSPTDIDRLALRLAEMLRSMQDLPLRNLAECFLTDDDFMRRLARSPAGIKNHHAYPGGLLEHVVNLMEVADSVAGHYPILNRDLLLMGVFLHDMGKVEELSSERICLYGCGAIVGARSAGDQHAGQEAVSGRGVGGGTAAGGNRAAAEAHDYQPSWRV